MLIEQVKPDAAPEILEGLVEVLVNCVNEGTGVSISFYPPLDPKRAKTFWQDKIADIAKSRRILLVAKEAGRIAGTVMVIVMRGLVGSGSV